MGGMADLHLAATEFVTTDDGVVLAVSVVGARADAPALLLVHGFGGAKEDFADHVEALSVDHRVVVFDLRGHGASGSPDAAAAYSLDRLAADVLAVADGLGLDSFRLLGHSMGGMVARRVVLARPDRVEALVLMDTSAGPPPGIDPELVGHGAEIARRDGMAALRALLDEINPLGSAAHERVLATRPGFKEFGDRKWASLSPVMWSELVVEITRQADELEALATVVCPTLVVVGEQDESFLEAAFAMADAVPEARLVVIPDAGHSPQFENPADWFVAVGGFLAELAEISPLRPSPGTAPARRSPS
jgi:2-succinyl-6-hydroxy-2,4-cyclohexadiene-1-carboxylate synthase